MVKDIGGEMISKIVTPETRTHLSIYEKEGTLQKHVTHEKYPTGHGRRHTQRKRADINRLIYANLLLIAPDDDPPPKDITGPTDVKLAGWFERNANRFARRADGRNVKVFTGATGNLLDALWTYSEDHGIEVDLTDIVDQDAEEGEIDEKALIKTIREDELSSHGYQWGFSEDFTRISVVLDENHVFETSLTRLDEAQRIISEEFGFDGFTDSSIRKVRYADSDKGTGGSPHDH